MEWIAQVELDATPEDASFGALLRRELPHVRVVTRAKESHRVSIDPAEWLEPGTNLLSFDRRIHGAEDGARADGLPFSLHLAPAERSCRLRVAKQVLTRYQRLFPRRNRSSATPVFGAVLERHAALHDRSKPLVRADYEHSLDVWQWVLRLAPTAGMAVQIAALFHDIERLTSEAEQRVEHRASDYLSFKQRHAAQGGHMTSTLLSELGLTDRVLRDAVDLVVRHEQPERGTLQLLNDADALSFFSLNAAGFLSYYGLAHTDKKVRYTVQRMSPRALAFLRDLRMPAEIVEIVKELSAPRPSAPNTLNLP